MNIIGWFLSRLFGVTFDDDPDDLCHKCGHADYLHKPDCRDVTQRGTRTSEWYCRCCAFQGTPPVDK